jgi:uncharacterized protein (DUF1778 family)
MYSTKKTGEVSQSFRIPVKTNKLIRDAADLDHRSINSWIVKTLAAAAKRQVNRHKKESGV